MNVFCCVINFVNCIVFSMGIESVVNENAGKASGNLRDAMCSACEMAVIWMQNQLKQNQTQDRILDYVNEVNKRPVQLFSIFLQVRLANFSPN